MIYTQDVVYISGCAGVQGLCVSAEYRMRVWAYLVATHLAIEVDPVALNGAVLGGDGHPHDGQGVLFGCRLQ